MASFDDRVYTIIREVPKGKVITYKGIGLKLHSKAYRAIGQALKRNPDAPRTPCHRVICSDGSLGGYHGKMKSRKKVALLRSEGVEVIDWNVDLEKYKC